MIVSSLDQAYPILLCDTSGIALNADGSSTGIKVCDPSALIPIIFVDSTGNA